MTSIRPFREPATPDPFRNLHERTEWILRRLEDPSHPLPDVGAAAEDGEQPSFGVAQAPGSPRDLVDRIVRQLERERAEAAGDGSGSADAFDRGGPEPSAYDDPNPSLLGAMPVGLVPAPISNYSGTTIPVPSPAWDRARDDAHDRSADPLPAWLPDGLRWYLHGSASALGQIPADLESLRRDFARDWPSALASLGPSFGPFGAAAGGLARTTSVIAQAAGYAVPAAKQGWSYLNRVGWDLPAALDNNALVGATKEGFGKLVDVAIGPGQPVVPIQAAREYIRKHGVEELRRFLASRGGRLAAAATDDEVRELQELARTMKPTRVLHTPDGRVAASALREEAPLVTRDRKLTNFMKAAEFDRRDY